MIQLNKTQREIIQCLSDGRCLSGTDIGTTLGISRTAVWKQVKQLVELGVPIQSLPQQGYQLTKPLRLLDEHHIKEILNDLSFERPLTFHLFASVDSTNRYLKTLPPSAQVELCCAEMQTHGRGRFNRHWYSPFGENLYLSLRRPFACSLSELSGLSLVVSLAIRQAIQSLTSINDLKVKWPNDLIWQDKKLSGTLIEIQAESHGISDVIIGIGINVNAKTASNSNYESSWCSLADITQQSNFDRNLLVAHLIKYIHEYSNRFLTRGLQAFQTEWNEADYLFNQLITVSQLNGEISGKAQGINELGQLKVIDQNGNTHYVSFGDTLLKRSMD
ncbi:biotin--[acetyl-CoA-carboxylase] ligase [Legionella yabuuchiae]|uniref:biotin--[acetyl-CoA-carboxylase] ligase n=1 Tax=Legionella yabuuchiae TaxID=376727 RepID=UPI0010568326|nr:biotin--[acetyl-CoA-carboxylase] ligase [Legionella yabuuchiae]